MRQYPWSLYFVFSGRASLLDNLTLTEVCLEAVKDYGWVLGQVPEKLMTREFCLEVVKKNGFAIDYLPWDKINLPMPTRAKLYFEAVKQDAWTLEDVPENLRDYVRRRINSGD